MRISLIFAVVATVIMTPVVAADVALQPHPFDECREGGEFIRNAAFSRDNGISREYFMTRLADDLELIRSFPPQLRWFVHNELDEVLLTDAAARVFDAPQAPQRHEIEFVDECMQSPLWRLDAASLDAVPGASN